MKLPVVETVVSSTFKFTSAVDTVTRPRVENLRRLAAGVVSESVEELMETFEAVKAEAVTLSVIEEGNVMSLMLTVDDDEPRKVRSPDCQPPLTRVTVKFEVPG